MYAISHRRIALTLSALAAFACMSTSQAFAQHPDLSPTYGSVTLKSGFNPDPFVKNVTSGGPIHTQLAGVNAHVADAPDFRLFYTAGSFPLTFKAQSSGDTTLLINLPDGSWIANDDGGSGLNPQIRLDHPKSGRYDIYVGSYRNTMSQAKLTITELTSQSNPAPGPVSTGTPDPSLNATYGSVTLQTGFLPDPVVRNVTAGGSLTTKLGGVSAHVASAPDYRLFYTAGKAPLTFSVDSAADTTLLINLPDGTWVANDDGAGNHNPMIRLTNPMSGRYDIFVGTFGTSLTAPARLSITERK